MMLTSFKTLCIEGPEAQNFLQSQLTLDVAALPEAHCQLTAYCNRQGLVESLFWLTRAEHGFRALIAEELVETTLALFKKYGAFSQVRFSLDEHAFELSTAQQDRTLVWHQHHLTVAEPIPALASQQSDAALWWRAYWLALNIPLLTQATRGLFRPHELNLLTLGAVSMTKGCYPGQEIVARMHYLGKSKQHLQRLRLITPHAPTPPPLPIQIVDSLRLTADTWVVSAVIRDDLYQQLPYHHEGLTLEAWRDEQA